MGSKLDVSLVSLGLRPFMSGILAALLLGIPLAQGQDEFDTVIEVRGKLKEVRGKIATVTREDGTDVAVMLHEDPTMLVFAAEAKPQFVAQNPNLLVRVETAFGPGGMPLAPLTDIEIFQPFQAGRSSSAQKDRYLPGIYRVDQPHGNAAGGQQGFEPGTYRIIGRVAGMGQAGMMINTGQMTVPVPVSPEAKWHIRFHDLTLAQPEDVIHVTGFHKPPNETEVKAGNVRVQVDRIYGEKQENPRATRRARGRATKEPPPATPATEPAQAE